jgi:hypothetical protein
MDGEGVCEYVKLLYVLATAGGASWGQMALALTVAISGPKKVSIFRAHPPSSGPCNGCCPHQNHYVLRHIKKRYIYS